MTLKIHEIQVINGDDYEVTFISDNGATEKAICRVTSEHGIQMEPDLMWTSELLKIDGREIEVARVNGREVAAAVLAFHRQRKSEPKRDSQT